MNILCFEKNDYREVFKYYCKANKITQKELAERARLHTSYFSRVMKGEANFSSTQIFTMASALGLDGPKLEFCLLAAELQQSTDETHRNYLREKIFKCQKEIQELTKRLKNVNKNLNSLEVKSYYQEAITARVHMLLTLDHFANNSSHIKKELNIDDDKLNEELHKLENLGLIQIENKKIKMIDRVIHLPEDHEVSTHNHKNWRLETVHKLTHKKKRPNDYHFSACFTANEKEKELIRNRFKEFIVDVQKLVTDCEHSTKLYHISFDLY